MSDPFAGFKEKQRQSWAHFSPVEIHTAPPAANLVRYARVTKGQRVLDVGTGTGVAALSAARLAPS
jgi:protein-L-isoaspartate O-methyltransferase